MRHFMTAVVVSALALSVPPAAAAQAGAAQAAAAGARAQTVVGGTVLNPAQVSITGSVVTPTGQPMSSMTAQARNLLTGQIGGTASASATGQFSILGLNPGNYVVEIVDATGQVVGTSAFISAAAGTAVAATITAASGALGAVTTVTGLAATLTTTAVESVKFAAAAAGVAGMVAPVEVPVASPSR